MEGRLSTVCPLICCEFTLPVYIRDLSSKSFHTWPHGPLHTADHVSPSVPGHLLLPTQLGDHLH